MKVEIYSDVVCPWCYIGTRRFARALGEFPDADQVEVVFRPYQLDPDASRTAAPLTDYLEQRFGARGPAMQQQVGALAAEEGISIDWKAAKAVNTWSAHRLLEWALTEHGADVQRDLAERLFDLHFSRGGNLGDHSQLVGAAVSAGMDRDRTAAYLPSDQGESELKERINEARSLGIQAVPTFVFDDQWAVQGAQSAETFAAALAQVEAARAEAGSSGDALPS